MNKPKPRTKSAPARNKAPAKRNAKPKKTAVTAPAPRGAPSKFSQAIADTICEHLANNGSLRGWFEANPDAGVSRETFRIWLKDPRRADFHAQYAQARKDQGDAAADEVTWIREQVASGKITPDQARVMVDAVKWTAGMMRADKYGPKVDHNHSGEVHLHLTPADAKQA